MTRNPTPPHPRRWHILRRGSVRVVRGGGMACMLLATFVLLGWRLDVPAFTGAVAGSIPMVPLTALAFLLCGLAIVLHAAPPASVHRRAAGILAQVLGAAVTVLAFAVGVRYLFGWDLGLDFFPIRAPGAPADALKGRMSPASAAALACVGFALAALPLPRLRTLVQGAAAAAAIIGVTTLASHLWGIAELRSGDAEPLPSLYASLGFVVLGVSIWLAAYRLTPGQRSLRFLLDPVELTIIASFAGALVLLTVVGGLSYGAAAESARVTQRLAQLELFHGRLTQLYADATEAAVSARSFVLTGQGRDAETWSELVSHLENAHGTAGVALDLTPGEKVAVAAFEEALAELASVFRRALDVYGRQGADEARLLLAAGADRQAMAKARAALAEAEDLGRLEQEHRQALLQRYRLGMLTGNLVLLALAAFMLAAVFTAIRGEMNGRAQAERAMRRRSAEAVSAHRFLESVIQNIPFFIFIKDAKELRFVRINRAGEQLFGLREAEVLGKTDHDFFPPQEAAFFISKDRQVLETATELDIPEEEIHTAQGIRLLHTRKLPLIDEHGRATHLMGIAEDVTEVRHKEHQIRDLNEQLRARAEEVERIHQARSAFLATMTHEIRTPMNGMIGMVELLGLSPLDARQRQMLGVIAESGQALLRIIDDVLDFSKIQAGKLELREEVVSVAGIVRAVCDIHSTSAGGKGLAITTWIDPALSPAVRLDPLRLRQILGNFVSNAIKFTHEGGVHVCAEVLEGDEQQQLLRLSVTDTGIGISAQDQERLFQPFVQVGMARAGMAGGTGLGLVISRQLAELMGGSVALRSVVGEGTTLSLQLPVRVAPRELLPKSVDERVAELRQATQRLRAAPTVAEAAAEGTLVLVVDDHPINRMLLQQQLAILGYAAEAVPDAEEALRRWGSGRFALVLTDCQMPGMNGYELTRRIRDHEAVTGQRRTPVVACTAMALADEIHKCRDAGMDDVIFKPVELGTLVEKMQRWLPSAHAPAHVELPPAPARERAATEPVDIRMLEETWGPDEDNIRSILEAYARSAREDYGALRDALARRDTQDLMHVAHRMLGASRIVGAHALAESCELVNASAREGRWPNITAAMNAVEAEYARVMARLDAPG